MPFPERTLTDEACAAALDAATALLGLTIDADWRDAVLFHMKVTAETAQLVLAFPLEDELEPAPVFIP